MAEEKQKDQQTEQLVDLGAATTSTSKRRRHANTTKYFAVPIVQWTLSWMAKDHEWSNGIKLGLSFQDSPSIYFIPQIPNEGEY